MFKKQKPIEVRITLSGYIIISDTFGYSEDRLKKLASRHFGTAPEEKKVWQRLLNKLVLYKELKNKIEVNEIVEDIVKGVKNENLFSIQNR